MRSRVYVTVGCPSVCPSVCRPPHAAAAGLLLWARRAEDIDLSLHGRRPAATASDVTLSADVESRTQTCCFRLPARYCDPSSKRLPGRRNSDLHFQKLSGCRLLVDGRFKRRRSGCDWPVVHTARGSVQPHVRGVHVCQLLERLLFAGAFSRRRDGGRVSVRRSAEPDRHQHYDRVFGQCDRRRIRYR